MGIFSKLFSHKNDDKKVGGMEDYMTLVRVYFQAALASQLGITNLAMLPDLRVFKTSLHVPTEKIYEGNSFSRRVWNQTLPNH